MSNTRWAIYRRATLDLMSERGIEDKIIGDFLFFDLAESDRNDRLRRAAEAEGVPDYFGELTG